MIQAPTKYDKYRSDFEALDQANGSGWLHDLRQQAFARFAELGFPTARRGNEKWKYTNVGPIANATFEYSFYSELDASRLGKVRELAPWDDRWTNLVFVNGRYVSSLSTDKTNGLRALSLAEAIHLDQAVVEKYLAKHATIDDDGFIALNTAFVRDGAFIQVPDGQTIDAPLHIVYVADEASLLTVSHPRTLIVAGKNSKLTVIETYISLSENRYFTNAVTEIVLEEGAHVAHHKLLRESPEAFHIGVTRVHQSNDSSFTSSYFAMGAAISRSDLYVLLDGPGAYCSLNGLYMTSGSDIEDNYINIDHVKPHTTSRLYYKGILDGKSRAVFGGTVWVRKDAQKSDAMQTDKNLLLSEEAEVDSKPGLMIFADDVKCGHGATAGHIDPNILFYMRSRGLDAETASGLLIQGFANEIIEKVEIEQLRSYLSRLFLGALPRFRFQFGPAP